MSQNLINRVVTSIILLSLLLFINFAHKNIFIIAVLTTGVIICVESNNLFSKLLFKKNVFFAKFNSKFLILNIVTFCYIFFIFCGFSYEIHRSEGPVFFLYIISICFFTDIGGYVVGKVVGGKKLSKISPNKTISGTIGSFLFSIIPLFLFTNIVYLDFMINFSSILYCLMISLVSQLGDLFISFLKRKAKIKDTGKILPGHGGFLDRLDGIIFAVPFSYLLLKLI